MAEPTDDVIDAIETIQDLAREEGDLAFPEIGAILAVTKTKTVARVHREINATRKELVRWHCPDCGIYACGFVPIDMEGPPQICRGNGREGGVCNGLMEQVYRGAA